jgi:hypothetical protein
MPIIVIFSIRFIKENKMAPYWAAALLVSLPAAIFTHPVTPVYIILNCVVISIACMNRRHINRILFLLGGSVFAYFLTGLVIDPADTHKYIESLAQLDLRTNSQMSYWTGHYVSPSNQNNSVRWYSGTEIPDINRANIFASPAIRISAWASLVWAVLFVVRSFLAARSIRPPISSSLTVGSVVLASTAILLINAGGDPLQITTVACSLFLSALSGLGLVAASWTERAERSHEKAELLALRIQGASMVVLVGIFVLSSAVLWRHMELWRGIERLHWFYLGLLPVGWLAWYLMDAARSAIRSSSCYLRRYGFDPQIKYLALVPHAALALICIDQLCAAFFETRSIASRIGLAAPFTEDPWFPKRQPKERYFLFVDEGAPKWLQADDRILAFNRPMRQDHKLLRNSVWYRELYSEAYAYQKLGEPFLNDWRAYNDLAAGIVDDRALQFIRDRGVTVVVFSERNRSAADKIRAVWPNGCEEISPNVLRLRTS